MTELNIEFKKTLLVVGLSALFTVGLTGCSDESSGDLTSDSGSGVSAPSNSQPSAADVKQPAPTALEQASESAAEKAQAVKESAQETAVEVKEAVKEKSAEVKEVVTEAAGDAKAKIEETKDKVVAAVAPATKSGAELYATCIGCHGAAGEGGVGPQLAGQSQADAAAKLHKYKSGEQVGPMTAMMAPMAQGLSDAEIEAVAEYTAGL